MVQRKGTPVRPVRIPDQLVAEVDLAVARLALWRKRKNRFWFFHREWSRSEFIVAAIKEKLKKMERSRRPHRRDRRCNTPAQ